MIYTGEVAKLFSDAGLICIASLISPYRRDRNSCRAMLPDASFIEVSFTFHFLLLILLVSLSRLHNHICMYNCYINTMTGFLEYATGSVRVKGPQGSLQACPCWQNQRSLLLSIFVTVVPESDLFFFFLVFFYILAAGKQGTSYLCLSYQSSSISPFFLFISSYLGAVFGFIWL